MNDSAFIWVVSFWMAAVGGAVGSFMNVVVYRLPAGLSLSRPGSHCPKCKHPIRWHDNVPVFGWLMLRGRCRDCREWIPPRYPTVEALVAALFLVIVIVEGAAFAANLPSRPVGVVDGLIFPGLSPWQISGLMGWHLLLLCTLICGALIRHDGNEVPLKLFIPALAVGLVGSFLWPHLHPQPATFWDYAPTPGIIDGVFGMAAGAVLGLAAWQTAERPHRPDLVCATTLVGLFLGWQPVVIIVPLALACAFAGRLVTRFVLRCQCVPITAWLAGVALVWILQWKRLAELVGSAS